MVDGLCVPGVHGADFELGSGRVRIEYTDRSGVRRAFVILSDADAALARRLLGFDELLAGDLDPLPQGDFSGGFDG